jgi:dipeptidyl aminopeptidase/acylaminoacyl peptidase
LFLDWEYASIRRFRPTARKSFTRGAGRTKFNDKYENEVWIVNADGSRNRFLLKGSSPVWSPDGKRIAYVAPGQPAGTQIFVKWMDTPDAGTQLTALERPPANLQWSPDGKRIAFNMLVPAKSQLKVICRRVPKARNGSNRRASLTG